MCLNDLWISSWPQEKHQNTHGLHPGTRAWAGERAGSTERNTVMISVFELREMEQGNKTFNSKLHFTITGIGKTPAGTSTTQRYSPGNHTAFFQPHSGQTAN